MYDYKRLIQCLKTDAFMIELTHKNIAQDCRMAANAIQELIDGILADEPVKHGKWIGEADGYADGSPVYDMWYCSCCDYFVDGEEPTEWNYCPCCGAKMERNDGQ